MKRIFIAVNSDDAGVGIGQAIAEDNYDGLTKLSDSLKNSHGMLEQWVEEKGGRLITSSSGELIAEIPVEAAQELQNIRSQYAKMSGNTLTIGVGSSMSEASKALLYGKLNSKNQIVEYEPQIDDYIGDEDEEQQSEGEELPPEGGEELPEEAFEEPVTSDEKLPPEAGVDADIRDQADTDVIEEDHEIPVEEGMEAEGEAALDEEGMDELPPSGQVGEGQLEGVQEESIDENEQEIPGELEDEEQIKVPSDMSDPEYGERQESEEDLIESPTEEDDAIDDLESDDTVDAAMIDDEDGEEEIMDELGPNDVESGELDGEQEADGDHQELLTNMIHGHMEDEDGMEEGMEGEMEDEVSPEMMEEGMEGEGDDEELKSDIIESLQAFRENKDLLEQAREANPQLYQATITMLRAMIEMAKRLSFSPEEDVESSDIQMESEEQLPPSQEIEGEEGEEEEMPPKR